MTRTAPQRRPVAWLRQALAVLITALAIVIILTAVLVGVGRALIPWADELRPWLEGQLSERLEQPVRIERVEAQWPRLTPFVTLEGLRLGEESELALAVDQARLEVHLPNLLHADRNLFRLAVLGLELVLAEDSDGSWGLELAGGGQLDERAALERLPSGDLLVRDADITIQPANLPPMHWRLGEGSLRRSGGSLAVMGQLNARDRLGEAVSFGLVLDDADGAWTAARGWAAAEAIEVAGLWPGIEAFIGASDTPARLTFESHLDWSRDDGGRVDLDFALETDSDAGFGDLAGELLAIRHERAIEIEVVELSAGGDQLVSGLRLGRHNGNWAGAVDHLWLERLHQAAPAWLAGLGFWPERLAGEASDLLVGWSEEAGLYALDGHLTGLAYAQPDTGIDIEGLDLALGLDGDRAVLAPGGQPRVVWPDLWREPLEVNALEGQVLVTRDTVEFRRLALDTAFTSARADGWLYRDGDRPFMDLSIDVERVESVDPRPWLPPRFVPAVALDWLDASFEWVEAAHGQVVLHMRAGKKAADINPGDFQAEVDFSGAVLDYWPGWPPATELAGRVDFIGNGLHGRIDRGLFGDLPVRSPQLSIGNLTEAVMTGTIIAEQTETRAISELFQRFPVFGWTELLEPMAWSGPADLEVELVLPFRDMTGWDIGGHLELAEAGLTIPAAGLELHAITGRVPFARESIGPARVRAELGSQALDLDLEAGLAAPAWLEVGTALDPGRLLADIPGLAGLGGRLRGQTPLGLRIEGGEADGLELLIESSLEGLSLALPAPLAKAADTAWPTAVRIGLGDDRIDARLAVEPWLDARLLQAGPGPRIAVGLNQTHPDLPASPGMVVRGGFEHLALDQWLDLPLDIDTGADDEALDIDLLLDLARVDLPGVSVDALNLALRRQPRSWQLDLVGDQIDGSLTVPVPLDSGRVVVADLRRLYLDAARHEEIDPELELQPLSAQTSTRSPVGFPPLHLLVEDLRWGELNLGRARLESHAVSAGVEVEMIDISGPDLRLQGRGRWIDMDSGPHSEFDGRLTTDNLRGLLASAGQESSIEAERAQVDMDFRWPGAPGDFALPRLSGAIELEIIDGTLPETRPGAGRLLGLASFAAIPRRLLLDFRDVFGQGLKFDDISGGLDLAAGFARTDGIVIRSPAATITITGATDMAAREYDQSILVEPGLSGALPVIGGLAGGPAGAAAGFVLRELLDRPLRGLSEARYRVTGPWHAPEVELVEARAADDSADPPVLEPNDGN